jgi:hypothetical protein
MLSIGSLFFAAAALAGASGAGFPARLLRFSDGVPAYLGELTNYVAREAIHQELFGARNGQVERRRDLVADYQIAPLVEDPSALFEFRFIRSVDGRNRPEVDGEIASLPGLRHANAMKERRRIVDLAIHESLPGCYFQNLTLLLFAFERDFLDDFEWKEVGDRFDFRQVKGPGIPEDYFDPKSPRSYPSGSLWLTPDGLSIVRLDLLQATERRSLNCRLEFGPPAPGSPSLPRHFEVRAYRPSSTGGFLEAATTLDYSDYRRFEVTTTSKTDTPPPR